MQLQIKDSLKTMFTHKKLYTIYTQAPSLVMPFTNLPKPSYSCFVEWALLYGKLSIHESITLARGDGPLIYALSTTWLFQESSLTARAGITLWTSCSYFHPHLLSPCLVFFIFSFALPLVTPVTLNTKLSFGTSITKDNCWDHNTHK